MVANHPADIQVFYADGLVFAHQHGRLFLQEIISLVCDPFVDGSYLNTLFIAVIRAFLFPGQPALPTDNLTHGPFKILGVRHYITVAVRVKFFDPDINADFSTIVLAQELH